MTQHPHLLSPLDLGFTTLSSRAVMGSMHTRLETLDRAHERIARPTERRGKNSLLDVTRGSTSSADTPKDFLDHRMLLRVRVVSHLLEGVGPRALLDAVDDLAPPGVVSIAELAEEPGGCRLSAVLDPVAQCGSRRR